MPALDHSPSTDNASSKRNSGSTNDGEVKNEKAQYESKPFDEVEDMMNSIISIPMDNGKKLGDESDHDGAAAAAEKEPLKVAYLLLLQCSSTYSSSHHHQSIDRSRSLGCTNGLSHRSSPLGPVLRRS